MLSKHLAGFEHIISGEVYKHIVHGRKCTKSKKKKRIARRLHLSRSRRWIFLVQRPQDLVTSPGKPEML